MSVFQYQDYRNPYGPSIAEALAHQADPQAAAALRAGDIEAQALARQSALRGQLVTQLGAIPGEMQAQQDAAQKRAAQQQQLQIGAQQLQAGTLSLQDAQAKRDAEARIGKQLEATPRGPNGTYDLRAFTQGLSGDDLKYVQPYLEHLTTVNTAWENEDAKRRGQLQQGATALLQAGAPFLPTQNLIDTGERDRVLTADQATSWRRQLLEDPAGAKGVLAGLAGYQKPITVKEDERVVNPVTLQTLVPAADDPSKGAYTINGQRFKADGTPIGPLVPKEAEPPKAGTPEEWVTRARRLAVTQNGGVPLTDQQLQRVDTAALSSFKAANADQDLRDAALAQRNIAAALAQLQLNQAPTPAQAASVADDLVNHRLAPEQLTSLFSTRGREGLAFKLAVSAEAKKLDPAFNFEEASSNYQLVKSPGFQNTVRYIDSVQESMPRLLQTATALGRGPVRSFNELANMAASQFNDTDLKRFKVDALLVGDEVAKLLSGGGSGSATSDAKLQQAASLISTADSVPAVASALNEINTLIGYRRTALTRGTYLEGTQAGGGRTATGAAPVAAAPPKGALRTLNGETRVWDGARWQPVAGK